MTTGPVALRGCAAVVVVALLASGGCSDRRDGPPRYAVTGRVTFQGKPLPVGRISFEPDAASGNTGPAGYGNILAGRFSTYPRMGAIGGAHVVRITGYDGIAKGESVEGQPLFPDYITTIDLPAKAATIDFDVPAAADKPQKPTGPTVLPKR